MNIFTHSPHWLWCSSARRIHNNVVCFRRLVDIDGDVPQALIRITADARYDLYVNGEWIGTGPVRSWKSPWPVDEYDLRGLLRPGVNAISVLVQHWGIATFQYLPSAPGLLAQLDWTDANGPNHLETDENWRCQPHEGYQWPVPRISCMQPWEEQFDARALPGDWTATDFDDTRWQNAALVCRSGEGEHAEFERRDIPFLTRQPVDPVRVLATEAVRPARYSWTVNPRELLNPTDDTANVLRGKMLVLTHIHSKQAQRMELHPPHDRPRALWKLNGREVAFDDRSLQKTNTGVAHVKLHAGWNVLMGRLPEEEHYWWAVLNVWTESPVRFAATREESDSTASWLAIGPFANALDTADASGSDANRVAPLAGIHAAMVDASFIPEGATQERLNEIWKKGTLDQPAPYARPIPADMVATVDVYAQCASERVVATKQQLVENVSAMICDTADWTTVHPARNADVRILFDFGREVVGYHEFEIDAPAGAIIDNHNFEFIQPDGRINLAEGMNNSFRYVCREGVQRYRTLVRRGFRYSWFSFRNFTRPIRVRFVRVLMSTYPQQRAGSFSSSDPLLDRIWEAGAHSVQCCSEDTYTDCPTYEQTFWVGDARNEALVDLVANGDPRLSAHSWRVAAGSLERSPIVESQVPSGWQNLLPAWTFLWMRWAQEHFELTGDRKTARYMVTRLRQNFAGMEKCVGPRGLINIRAWNMFDWAAMDTPADGEVTHLNCLAVLGLNQSAELAESVGARADAKRWRSMAEALRRSINAHLWDGKRNAYVDCIRADGTKSPVFSQQTHTAAYIAGIPTGARMARTRDVMFSAPPGFVTAGSPFFMFFLLEAYVRENQIGQMLETIRQYWGEQVRAGATTFWETYDPNAARMTRSHCHGWSAAPTYFLTRYVLGIQPAEPGYKLIRIAPPPIDLRWARGRVPTPQGAVECEWQQLDDLLSITVNVPTSQEIEVVLPYPGKLEILNGRLKSRAKHNGFTSLKIEGKQIKLKLRRAPSSAR